MHANSGQRLFTDAPLDHEGKGENFAPTDLLAAAVGTCFLTVMGITAKEKGWKLDDLTVSIEKKMTTEGPRKIEYLSLHIEMPYYLKPSQLKILQKATKDCPVLRVSISHSKLKLNGIKRKRKT